MLFRSPALPNINASPHEMQQVLLNMIDNAIHAQKGFREVGNITICTRALSPERLQLSIRDDGPGILPEHKERLLLPFFTTKRVGEGSGLGLSISYGILRAHGATLQVHSEYGQGAEFVMEFPVLTTLHVLEENRSTPAPQIGRAHV